MHAALPPTYTCAHSTATLWVQAAGKLHQCKNSGGRAQAAKGVRLSCHTKYNCWQGYRTLGAGGAGRGRGSAAAWPAPGPRSTSTLGL